MRLLETADVLSLNRQISESTCGLGNPGPIYLCHLEETLMRLRRFDSASPLRQDRFAQSGGVITDRPDQLVIEKVGDLMREVEVQLGCAVAILRSSKQRAAATMIAEIQELKHQTEFLVLLVAETNRFLSGWVSRVLISRNGYTDRGAAAPLFLVRKTSAEG